MAVGQLLLYLGVFGGLLAVGTSVYMYLEEMPWIDALYLTVATVSTVGYGDVVPKTPVGRMFTICLIIGGVGGSLFVLTRIFQAIVQGELKNILGRRGMQRKIDNLSGHVIVCGAGRVGNVIIERLQQEQQPFIVLDREESICRELSEQGILTMQGDATIDAIMMSAGVQRAKGVIAALPHDADNVYVTLTARSLNQEPSFSIVARADRPEAVDKLKRAGATTVVSPETMGGRQMATAMTKPAIIDLMDNVFYNQELHLDIAEVRVAPESDLVGTSLAVCGIKEKYDSLIVGIQRGGKLVTDINQSEIVEAGDVLIVIGHRDNLKHLSQRGEGAENS